MLAFQRVQPRLIWSFITPGIDKYMRRGRAVTSADRLGKLTKQENLVMLGAESSFFPLRKCVASCLNV
jgi:hypothetical protein